MIRAQGWFSKIRTKRANCSAWHDTHCPRRLMRRQCTTLTSQGAILAWASPLPTVSPTSFSTHVGGSGLGLFKPRIPPPSSACSRVPAATASARSHPPYPPSSADLCLSRRLRCFTQPFTLSACPASSSRASQLLSQSAPPALSSPHSPLLRPAAVPAVPASACRSGTRR